MFRSTDHAKSFVRITPLTLDPNQGPSRLIISGDGDTVYYATPANQLFCSLDGGDTFPLQSTLPTQTQQFAIDPDNAAVLYATAGFNFLKSMDHGAHWTALPKPASGSVLVTALLVVRGTPNTLWLETSGGLFSTTNDGATWTPSRRMSQLIWSPIAGTKGVLLLRTSV